jgi:hypothetical protein
MSFRSRCRVACLVAIATVLSIGVSQNLAARMMCFISLRAS